MLVISNLELKQVAAKQLNKAPDTKMYRVDA